MIRQVTITTYHPTCDHCGRRLLDRLDILGSPTPEDAADTARGFGWTVTEHGACTCNECKEKP